MKAVEKGLQKVSESEQQLASQEASLEFLRRSKHTTTAAFIEQNGQVHHSLEIEKHEMFIGSVEYHQLELISKRLRLSSGLNSFTTGKRDVHARAIPDRAAVKEHLHASLHARDSENESAIRLANALAGARARSAEAEGACRAATAAAAKKIPRSTKKGSELAAENTLLRHLLQRLVTGAGVQVALESGLTHACMLGLEPKPSQPREKEAT
jgi:organic radical activating enzyme